MPIVPIYNIEGFTNSPQTEARKFYSEMKHPVVGKFKYPGPPYKWSETHCETQAARTHTRPAQRGDLLQGAGPLEAGPGGPAAG